MAQLTSKKSLEEFREERRRARWSAFWTPFITLASIVISVGMLMFLARTCRERFPQFTPPGAVEPPGNPTGKQGEPADSKEMQNKHPAAGR